MKKIILLVFCCLFFQVNLTLAAYVYDWSGVCSSSCGKGTETGTRYYQSCTTDKDSGVETCSALSSPTSVSRSCLGTSCSGRSKFYSSSGGAFTLSINKSTYNPSETIGVSSNLAILACANDNYAFSGSVATDGGSSAQIFSSAYHGTGEYFNTSSGTFADYLVTTYVYSASASLTAPSSGGNYSVWASFMSGSIPYSVSAPSYSCTGTTPSNATMCTGDNTGLTSDVSKLLVSSCTTSRKCEYTCNSGYNLSGGSCVASTAGYNCNSSTGSCSYVSSGASYSSLSTCDANCSADTSGYNCNSSTGSCYSVSSGASYSSLSTCNANCSAPVVNQRPTASITAPSGNRTITAGQSISFSGTGSDPDGSITSYRWNSSSCSGTQLSSSPSFTRTFNSAGTYRIYFSVRDDDGAWSTNCPYRTITVDNPCVDTTWTPSTNTVCVGTSLTQTSNCGTTRTVSGTGTCNLSGYSTINHSCSSNILTTTERWYSYYCVSGGCSSPVLVDSSSSTDPCDTGESCATATPKSRCSNASTVENYKEYIEGTCNASLGLCVDSDLECDISSTPCEEGYVCKETGTDQAECVPKATTWTET